MWVSKLSKNKYPTANPNGILVGDWENLDPVFAGRLARLCKMTLTESYRSTARQTDLYNQYLDYKRTGKGNIKSAARPGESWHEFRLAIDTSSQPIRSMTNAQLAQYGLCKPIKKEGWHVQPIETLHLGAKANTAAAKALYPVWQKQEETEVVKEIKIMIDGIEKTVSAINVNGSNFVQLRDLTDALIVGYDVAKNMPIIKRKDK